MIHSQFWCVIKYQEIQLLQINQVTSLNKTDFKYIVRQLR